MARPERLKASDNFKKSAWPKTDRPIIECFPNVSTLSVEVTNDRQAVIGKYTQSRVPDVVNCQEKECDGGFYLAEDIRDMLRSGETKREFMRGCPGYWVSPQGRRKRRKCMQVFHVTILATYREQDQ